MRTTFDHPMPATPAPTGLVASIVAVAFFMQNLDATIIVTALPAIAADFGVSPLDMSIGITSYMLAMAAALPASAWIADRFGAKRVFAGAVTLFTLASLACAVAPSLAIFVGARILQGLAGALMMPVGRLVVLRNTRNADLVKAVATITWPGLIAPVIGPPLGGLITLYGDWPWIFLVNLPIGLVGLVLIARHVPDIKAGRRDRFDLIGFSLSALALVLVLVGLESIVHAGGSRIWLPLAAVMTGLMLGILAFRHLRQADQPLVRLGALAAPTFTISTLGEGFVIRGAIAATPFLLPLMFQVGFGLDAFSAGLFVFAYMGGNLAMKSVTTPLLRRFGFRPLLVGNGLIIAASLAACAVLTPATPVAVIVVVLVVAGLARSMQFTCLATLAFADIAQDERASATTISAVAGQLTQTLGVATAALLLGLAPWLRAGEGSVLADFHLAFAVTAGPALISALGFLRLAKDAGAEVSGRGAR